LGITGDSYKNFANYSALLTTATSGKAPGNVRWSQEMLWAFYHLC